MLAQFSLQPPELHQAQTQLTCRPGIGCGPSTQHGADLGASRCKRLRQLRRLTGVPRRRTLQQHTHSFSQFTDPVE